ncbi:MAG: TlyA family RNA methyltransferase [Oscillospiraceae bacterium]|jgi:23S rRNA (cytidine1920-2'-O)/16S rRNA (cytidine1409-2'-O)-methyltransferase|nr:TlyA family RNA methyltransferase [Oscillospiraceae bacterium]
MKKTRLDVALFERGLTDSREKARALIMSGIVYVSGQKETKPGTSVAEDAAIELRGEDKRFVSRGGFKLEKALDTFGISPENRVCIDCGASTGGFTDCLLRRGAAKVYAVDVGYGQLAWSVRSDPRVVTLERTNARYLTRELIPEPPSLAVIDVSFISLSLILPAVRAVLAPDGEVACLIKPQFEAGRDKVGKKGVVRDAATHVAVLERFIENATEAGFAVDAITYSPIKGPEGNIEFLGHLTSASSARIDATAIVAAAHAELNGDAEQNSEPNGD